MRQPITIQLTRRIKMALLQEPHSYDNVLLWATCCISFFGFLKCSEFTVTSIQEYDPSTHLSYNDVSIDCRDSPSAVQILIKQSKTDPFRKSVYLRLGKTDSDVCPVKAIPPYMVIRGSKPEPLFLTADSKPLTHQRFHTSLSRLLK